MYDLLNNLNLTTTHYYGIAGVVIVLLFLIYYFFLRSPSEPQGINNQELPQYKELEHFDDMSDQYYEGEEGYEDYGEMPELEPIHPQQQQQMQQPGPVAHGSYQQDQFGTGGGEPMAANSASGNFQSL